MKEPKSTRRAIRTGPQYVSTVRVYPKPDTDDEPWPDTATIKPRAIKPKRTRCRWCGAKFTDSPDGVCPACWPFWEHERIRKSKGDYPLETKGTA